MDCKKDYDKPCHKDECDSKCDDKCPKCGKEDKCDKEEKCDKRPERPCRPCCRPF